MAESDQIQVRVKFLRDHGDQKKDSTKTVTLSEARRLKWAGAAEELGRSKPSS
jgi:hypothetical protein